MLHKEILKGDSKRSYLILPMMKNHIEKCYPSEEFGKSKVRILVRSDLQKLTGETLMETESIVVTAA